MGDRQMDRQREKETESVCIYGVEDSTQVGLKG